MKHEYKQAWLAFGLIALFYVIVGWMVYADLPPEPPAPTCWCKIDPRNPKGRTTGVVGCLHFDTNEMVVYATVPRS